jgi:hypothetical protein
VKRGLITWDRAEVPLGVFERRWEKARQMLSDRGLPALVVYSDLWRSNQARFLANYMPYFNRALLILPVEGKVTLLCGLSPRTYRWIQSVTPIEDVRSGGNFAGPLNDIAAERGWSRVGALDFEQFPHDLARALRAGGVEIVGVESSAFLHLASDDAELALRRRAVVMARTALERELEEDFGKSDYAVAGRLEGRLRRAGAEDLVLHFSNGDGPPTPAKGQTLGPTFSASLALEYRGHWVHVTRGHGGDALRAAWNARLQQLRDGTSLPLDEVLDGAYPFECRAAGELRALHVEIKVDGKRVFHGDTCWDGPKGWEIL